MKLGKDSSRLRKVRKMTETPRSCSELVDIPTDELEVWIETSGEAWTIVECGAPLESIGRRDRRHYVCEMGHEFHVCGSCDRRLDRGAFFPLDESLLKVGKCRECKSDQLKGRRTDPAYLAREREYSAAYRARQLESDPEGHRARRAATSRGVYARNATDPEWRQRTAAKTLAHYHADDEYRAACMAGMKRRRELPGAKEAKRDRAREIYSGSAVRRQQQLEASRRWAATPSGKASRLRSADQRRGHEFPGEVTSDRMAELVSANVCGICELEILEGVPTHWDHIVPVVAGGRAINSNVQLAHASCNMSKGAKVAA